MEYMFMYVAIFHLISRYIDNFAVYHTLLQIVKNYNHLAFFIWSDNVTKRRRTSRIVFPPIDANVKRSQLVCSKIYSVLPETK